MTKDLFIRGLNDEIHKKLTEKAEKKGVSLNSLLKDVVDKWADKHAEISSKHELILYSDEQTLKSFLKSLDYSSNEKNMMRVYCGPKDNPGVKFLKNHGWIDGAIGSYKQFGEKPYQYTEKMIKKIEEKLQGKSLFGLMFLADYLSENKSTNQATKFCQWYEQKQVPGNTYCLMNSKNLPSNNIEKLLEFFDSHDQVFLIRKKGLFKIHLSEESIHKLFLN